MAAPTSVPQGSFNPDADVPVLFDDQQKINKFARQNARLEDLIDELKAKEKELQNLEDAEADLMLSMDESKIPYMFGEVFVELTLDDAQQMLDSSKDTVKKDIEGLKEQQDSIKQVMSDLKVQLYAKFGNNINLEPDDS